MKKTEKPTLSLKVYQKAAQRKKQIEWVKQRMKQKGFTNQKKH